MRPGPEGAGISSSLASPDCVNSLRAATSAAVDDFDDFEEDEDFEDDDFEVDDLEEVDDFEVDDFEVEDLEVDEEDLEELDFVPAPPLVSEAGTKGNISSKVKGGVYFFSAEPEEEEATDDVESSFSPVAGT